MSNAGKWRAPPASPLPLPPKQVTLYMPRGDEFERILRGVFLDLFDPANFWDENDGVDAWLAAGWYLDITGITLTDWSEI